ncbi:MAG: hypothetical protein LBK47_05660 [Prevotellaceae bacterium]|jgi:hypothetical protein|nr:hypothetical protein [Prevotellaceae bacterium]
MKILFHDLYADLNVNNKLFEDENTAIGDDLLKPFHVLAKLAEKQGVEVGTWAKISKESADAIVFVDYPKINDPVFQYAIHHDVKKYLISLESPIISKRGIATSCHDSFDKIFTWSDDLVAANPQKYIKINYSFDTPPSFAEGYRSKHCIVIAGNKGSSAPNELYSERLKCIKWFEEHAPSDFDLYGLQWDLVLWNSDKLTGRIFNKINRQIRFFRQNFNVYKGAVERKRAVMSLYNFSLCLENVHGYNGYITEKIFDCLFAGTIPIYKGARNIAGYIPQSCFVNYDDFNSISDMHDFITGISSGQVLAYQKNIKAFLQSKDFEPFLSTTFANTVLSNIVCD